MQVALIILDGWGIGQHDRRNAIEAASTPTFDGLWERGATGTLTTAGETVGLPPGQAGNSEVGHLTIGAGRPIEQESARIEAAIANDTLGEVPAIRGCLEHVKREGSRLHLLGLISDGGVHANHEHVHALIRLAAKEDIEAVTHAFTDGRDTSPDSGRGFIDTLQTEGADAGTGTIATVSGRYYAMDRDQNWERTYRAYTAMVDRESEYVADDPVSAVESAYERGVTDEFIEPTIIEDTPAIADDDAVLFCNYRADRARQLTRMLGDIEPVWDQPTSPPSIHLATMTAYDETFEVPVAFDASPPSVTLGSVLEAAGLTQLRAAESEKYPHVTYFLNGGREGEFDGEHRLIVDSPDVATYDLQPEMSARTLTDVVIERIEREDPDVLVLNYANPDMVGHTGDYEAAIEAVEAVDTELERLVRAIQAAGGDVIVTADHGNADDMGTAEKPHTAHTDNPVPVIFLDTKNEGRNPDLGTDGTLADIAPTILKLLGVARPAEMTGSSLLE